jgi:hypothetical protein
MKKISVILICLSIIFVFAGCRNAENEIEPTPTAAADPNQDEQDAADENNGSQDENEVVGKAQLYEGIYFDDRRFGENNLMNYCEVEISNITDTSFDFTVYEVSEPEGEEKKEVIFLTNTAVFIDDGSSAAYYGDEYTLKFTFPNNHNAEPVVTDMEISGFEPLEGNTYVNNGIPGHEFG